MTPGTWKYVKRSLGGASGEQRVLCSTVRSVLRRQSVCSGSLGSDDQRFERREGHPPPLLLTDTVEEGGVTHHGIDTYVLRLFGRTMV